MSENRRFSKVLRVTSEVDKAVRERAREAGMSPNEAACSMLSGRATATPAELPDEIKARLSSYADTKGVSRADALAQVLAVGFKRIDALERYKASR